jgi:hypothetical protein
VANALYPHCERGVLPAQIDGWMEICHQDMHNIFSRDVTPLVHVYHLRMVMEKRGHDFLRYHCFS